MLENEEKNAALFFDAGIREIAGRKQPASVKVLDFGCGCGELVGCLGELGYDAHGCDMGSRWKENPDACSDRFLTIEQQPYRLPYADDSFEVVISSSVLEHAQNKVEFFREIHRVLKPGGHALHMLPGKWYLPAEPHIYVPLVNFFWPRRQAWWLALWAWLGVRNRYQVGKPWREVLKQNIKYCRDGLSYWSTGQYRKLSLEVFGNFSMPMDFYIRHGYGRVPRILRKLPLKRLTGWLSGETRMNIIVQQKTPAATGDETLSSRAA